MDRPIPMTQDRFDELVRTEGANFACWEGAASLWRIWQFDHPEDERQIHEVMGTDEWDQWAESTDLSGRKEAARGE